jgi:hypothetical protein
MRRLLLIWLSLGLLCGCEVLRVDACADRRTADLTCVNLQLEGDLPELDLLAVAVSGDWVGYSEAPAQNLFRLPAAVAVALPRTFAGSVRLEVQALRGRTLLGQGSAVAQGLMPGEHRTIEIILRP